MARMTGSLPVRDSNAANTVRAKLALVRRIGISDAPPRHMALEPKD